MRLFYTQEALNERIAAFRWYQEQRDGLGLSFLAHLEYLVNNIVDFLLPLGSMLMALAMQ